MFMSRANLVTKGMTPSETSVPSSGTNTLVNICASPFGYRKALRGLPR